MKANLAEIMESIQGEGLLVGSRQVFLRFSGCNLRCSYCDTAGSFESQPYCKIFPATGRAEIWDNVPNPLSIDQIVELIRNYRSKWISLTGGEPLLWSDFISKLGNRLKPQGCSLMLETNGLLYEQLESCIEILDMISMDFKPPSATGEDNWVKHTQFLARAVKKPVYTKIVIDSKISEAEVKQAVDILAGVDVNIPLILQPVTPISDVAPPDLDKLLNLQKICLEVIRDVRILPQIHKLMGLI